MYRRFQGWGSSVEGSGLRVDRRWLSACDSHSRVERIPGRPCRQSGDTSCRSANERKSKCQHGKLSATAGGITWRAAHEVTGTRREAVKIMRICAPQPAGERSVRRQAEFASLLIPTTHGVTSQVEELRREEVTAKAGGRITGGCGNQRRTDCQTGLSVQASRQSRAELAINLASKAHSAAAPGGGAGARGIQPAGRGGRLTSFCMAFS